MCVSSPLASDRSLGLPARPPLPWSGKGVSVCEGTVRAVMREQGLQAPRPVPEGSPATALGLTDLDERPWPRAPRLPPPSPG